MSNAWILFYKYSRGCRDVAVSVVAEGAAVFFEFKHYKPKGKYMSVRCWSLLEMDEVSMRANTRMHKRVRCLGPVR